MYDYTRPGRKHGRRFTYKSRRKGAPRFLARALRRLTPRRLLVILCAAVALYCGIRLIVYFAGSAATKQKNRELQTLYAAQATQPPQAQFTASPDPSPALTPAPEADAAALAPGKVTPIPASSATLRPSYQAVRPTMLDSMRALYARNKDTVGWLTIPGVVDLPVVHRDNTYYLTHDFDGKKNAAGTLFMDELHPFTAKTQYLVIHGHNMNDGTMFGLLAHYAKKINYVREHGIVSFSSLYQKESYAVLVVPDSPKKEGFVPYLGTPTFYSEAQFNAFIDTLKSGSLYYIPIQADPSDALLTLSTCIDDDRLIVVCRRLRAGETEETLKKQLAKSIQR